jgi:hypothetical protein
MFKTTYKNDKTPIYSPMKEGTMCKEILFSFKILNKFLGNKG